MILRTNCERCVFKSPYCGCQLNKPVTIEKVQTTNGYCGQKRISAWLKKFEDQDVFVPEQTLETIAEENAKLSVIIVMLNDDIKGLRKTLDSLVNDTSLIKKVCVATQNSDKVLDEEILIILSEYKQWAWHLENIKYENPLTRLGISNYMSNIVKNTWIFSIENGDTVHPKDIEFVYESILNKNKSYLGFYYDESDSFKTFVNKDAFWSMSGHQEEPWLDKIKQFENWKEVCPKIISR